MRIGLVVDAACDLPDACLEAHGIRILPCILELDGRTWLDERDPGQTMMFYRRHIADRATDARSSACSAAEISEIFLQELVLEYDRILVITACAEFSDMFAAATEASYGVLQAYRERRATGERGGSFALRVLDSGTICAGQAVLVCRALQLAGEGALGFENMRRVVREEAGRVTCLVVPGDPWYVRRRGFDGKHAAISRGDYALAVASDLKPVIELSGGRSRTLARRRGFQAACGHAFERVGEAIMQGTGAPVLALSFGGDPRIIRQMPAFKALEAQAAAAHMELHLAVMSATMGVRLGPGALSVAWLAAA
jgi:DegV family protein with EDD domain